VLAGHDHCWLDTDRVDYDNGSDADHNPVDDTRDDYAPHDSADNWRNTHVSRPTAHHERKRRQ
jgi:hypothetical protein